MPCENGALGSAHPLYDRTPPALPACDRGCHNSKHIAVKFIPGMTDKSSFEGLNVGGRIFLTSHSTLTRDSNSMLTRMFNETLPPSSQDKDGHYIIELAIYTMHHHAARDITAARERDFRYMIHELEFLLSKLKTR